jgi:hypothetical protein
LRRSDDAAVQRSLRNRAGRNAEYEHWRGKALDPTAVGADWHLFPPIADSVSATAARAVVRQPLRRGTRYAAETYADSAGRKATLPDGPRRAREATPRLFCGEGRKQHSCQALPKNTKPSVVAKPGDRRVTTLDRHLPGSIFFWEIDDD